MADIPQEVRDSLGGSVSSRVVGPMSDHERFITAVAFDCGFRAGMERAAEIADDAHNATGLRWTPKAIAQAIRSEADG